jgi:hypothetical protein
MPAILLLFLAPAARSEMTIATKPYVDSGIAHAKNYCAAGLAEKEPAITVLPLSRGGTGGTALKTINGNSVVGSGNISFSARQMFVLATTGNSTGSYPVVRISKTLSGGKIVHGAFLFTRQTSSDTNMFASAGTFTIKMMIGGDGISDDTNVVYNIKYAGRTLKLYNNSLENSVDIYIESSNQFTFGFLEVFFAKSVGEGWQSDLTVTDITGEARQAVGYAEDFPVRYKAALTAL